MHPALLLVHPTINGKSHLCPLVIFFKKIAVSRLSLSPASRFNFFFFLGVLLLLLQSSSFICFFNLLHSLLLQSSSCAPPRFHLLHCSWRFCFLASSSRFFFAFLRRTVVWFFFAFLLHLGHLASSSRYVFSFALLLLPPLLSSMAETAIGKLMGCLRIT